MPYESITPVTSKQVSTVEFAREKFIEKQTESPQDKVREIKTKMGKKISKKKKKAKKIGRILRKPKVQIIPSLSAVKAISKGIPKDAALVSKGQEGYFQEEYAREQKWLGEYSL